LSREGSSRKREFGCQDHPVEAERPGLRWLVAESRADERHPCPPCLCAKETLLLVVIAHPLDDTTPAVIDRRRSRAPSQVAAVPTPQVEVAATFGLSASFVIEAA
jgi:hypothetical protein